jgi:hypothetical protein
MAYSAHSQLPLLSEGGLLWPQSMDVPQCGGQMEPISEYTAANPLLTKIPTVGMLHHTQPSKLSWYFIVFRKYLNLNQITGCRELGVSRLSTVLSGKCWEGILKNL